MLIDLVKFFSTKENYEKCFKFVKSETLPIEVKTLLQYFKVLYSGGTDAIESYKDVYVSYAINNPTDKNLVLLESLCNSLDSSKALPIDEKVVQLFIDKLYAEKLAEESTKIADGTGGSFTGIEKVIAEYKSKSVRLDKALKELEIEDMLTSLTTGINKGYKWRMPCLNEALGELSTQFIIVAARPDGGKTTFFAQEAWYIAKQLPEGKCVLWFNNEEHIREVKKRVISSALKVPKKWIEENPMEAWRKYTRFMGGEDKIVFIDDAHDMRTIDKGIEKYNPGLIIIDQLFKVKDLGSSGELDAERFRLKCAYAREIAKHTAPVLASNQLDAQAEGVKYPSMDCLYGSKTGAQGEADAILLIGRAISEPDKRFIYTPKNKLTGSNEKYEVILEKDIARFN